MAYGRRSTSGIAVVTTLSVGINDSVEGFTIADDSGWPSGSGGPFWAQIDDEVIDCESNSGGVITVVSGGRGASDTPAASHLAGAEVSLVFTSQDADQANYVVSETVGKVTTSQDLLVADGANSLTRLGITNNRLLIVTGNTVSWGQATSAMLATDSVGSAQIAADAVGSSEIAALAVGTGELAAQAVTEAKLHTSVVGAGITGGNGTPLAVVVDASSIEINTDTLRVKAAGITQAMHAAGTLPTLAAAPTPSGTDGQLWYDTTNELLFAYNGTNWVCITPKSATTAGAVTTGSTSYTTLSGNPVVTIVTGTKALVTISCGIANDTAHQFGYASFVVSSATTLAADDDRSIYYQSYAINAGNRAGGGVYLTGLTAGSNVFTMQNRVLGGTGEFQRRTLTVVGIP